MFLRRSRDASVYLGDDNIDLAYSVSFTLSDPFSLLSTARLDSPSVCAQLLPLSFEVFISRAKIKW